MLTQSTLMTMSQEVLLMIFIQVYSTAIIHFEKGVVLKRHNAPNTVSWVPEELISPMLICKYLRPIAWEAFLKRALFVFPGKQMMRRTAMRLHSWFDIKLAKDPTNLARRVQSDLDFADMFGEHWTASENLLPNLKDLTITGQVDIDHRSSKNNLHDFYNIRPLQDQCSEKGVRFNAYIILLDRRTQGTRIYTQTVRLVVGEDGSVAIKEIRAAQKAFYDDVKQLVKEEFDRELEDVSCKRGRKLINYVDEQLDWQEQYRSQKR